MSAALLLVAAVLAIGLWGYFQQGDTFYVINKLSASEIAAYASQAGFSGDNLVTAVAIALAESGGDPQAQGDKSESGVYTSLGLWQIHYTVHPEFDRSQLFDPQYNANAAYALFSRRGNFNDWSTYTVVNSEGVLPYANYLNEAATAVNG